MVVPNPPRDHQPTIPLLLVGHARPGFVPLKDLVGSDSLSTGHHAAVGDAELLAKNTGSEFLISALWAQFLANFARRRTRGIYGL